MKKYTVLYLFIITASSMIISCAGEKSVTDVISVTKANRFITDADLEKGVVATKSKVADVPFSHSTHDKKGIKCIQCHHKKNNDERIKVCSSCHKGLAGTRTIHAYCIDCHTAKSGPTKCEKCHIEKKQTNLHGDLDKIFKKSFVFSQDKHDGHSKNGTKCTVCHHDSTEKDTKKKNCSVCHEGDSKIRIMHHFCKDCHNKKSKGPVSCTGCHKVSEETVKSFKDMIHLDKTGHRLPKIAFNHKEHIEKYDTECVDCHHNGSLKKCSSCHLNRDQENIINLRGAYHQQCQDCHRRTEGPRSCMKCHGKKE